MGSVSTIELAIGGTVMLFSLVISPRLVDSHWPDATAAQRSRWIGVYRGVFGAWLVALLLGWAFPSLGGGPFVLVFALSVLGIAVVLFRNGRSDRD
jgi:uncharacterized membrane protein YdcZ (DUF606 family)